MQKKLWNRDFLLLFQGSAVSTIGDLMYSVAIGYWVYQKTGSSGLMGVMSSISMFVTMFLSPFCGSIVDRCNRKWVMVGIDVLQGLLMLMVGALAYSNALGVPMVLLAAFLAAFCGVFYSPATSTLLLDIIPRDDMVRGQSLFSGMNSLINTVGSAFSGAMVAFFGVPLIVVLNGLSNLYSAASALFIRVPRTAQQGEPVSVKSVLESSKAAVKEIFRHDSLRVFVPCALILNLLGAGPMTLMLPFCMEKGFTVDMYGYLVSIWTASYLLATLILGVVKLKPAARFWVMAVSFSASVVFFALAYLSRGFLMVCAMAFIAGLLNCAGNTVFNASLMLALPENNRSAILGFIQSAATGGTALSAVLYGVLGDVFPLHLVFAVGNGISLVPMLYMCFHRHVRAFILEN